MGKKSQEILIDQTYGDEEGWISHFYYLLPFFKDERYIKIDGCPIFIIYRPEIIPVLKEMIECWKELARKNGIKDIKFIYQQSKYNHLKDSNGDLFDYAIEYQPGYAKLKVVYSVNSIIRKAMNSVVIKLHLPQTKLSTIHYSYDRIWNIILNTNPRDFKMLPGAFVDWDNTPRYKKGACVYIGFTPEKFQSYLSRQIRHAREVYKKDIIFMFAWNEWGEGGFLEPDETDKYKRLEAVRSALVENGEFPE